MAGALHTLSYGWTPRTHPVRSATGPTTTNPTATTTCVSPRGTTIGPPHHANASPPPLQRPHTTTTTVNRAWRQHVPCHTPMAAMPHTEGTGKAGPRGAAITALDVTYPSCTHPTYPPTHPPAATQAQREDQMVAQHQALESSPIRPHHLTNSHHTTSWQ